MRSWARCSRPCPQSPAPLVDRDGVQPPPPVARAQLPGRHQPSHATPEDDDPGRPGQVREEVIGSGGVTGGEGRREVTSASASTVRQSSGLESSGRRASSTAARRRATRAPWCLATRSASAGRRPPRGVLAGGQGVASPVAEQLGEVEVLPVFSTT